MGHDISNRLASSVKDKNRVVKDTLGFIGVFMFFGIGAVFSILLLIGLKINFLTSGNYIALVKYIFYTLLTLRYLKRIHTRFLWGLLLFGIVLLASCLINQENATYIIEIMKVFLLNSLPLIIIMLYIGNPEKILKYMRYSAYLVAVRTWFVPFSNLYLDSVGYMSLAYGSMVSWAVLTYYAFEERKWLDILFSLITAIFYIVFASRGAILCVAGYLLFCVWFFIRDRQRLYLVSIICGSAGLIYYHFQTILLWATNVMGRCGMSSRTISLVMSTNFLNDSGRVALYKEMTKAIFDNPFGYGIGYDRIIGDGLYAHNLFLELFIAFGVALGSLIATFIIYIYVVMLFKCTEKSLQALFSVFAVPGFIMLQMSGSVFIDYHIIISIIIFVVFLRRKNDLVINIKGIDNDERTLLNV